MPQKQKRKRHTPKKHCPGQGKILVMQEAWAPKKTCHGQGKTQVLQEPPAPKKHWPDQVKTPVLQEAPAPKKKCPGQGKSQVLQEAPAPKKHWPDEEKARVLQEAPAPKKYWTDQEKTKVLQEAPGPKKHCPGKRKTLVLQEAPAPKKLCPGQGKILVIQETQSLATNKKILLSSSPLLVVTPGTDSASQSPSPLEDSERAVSTTVATDKSNQRSNEGSKCKSKKKHLSSQAPSSTIQPPKDALTKVASKLVNYIIEMHKMQKPIKKNDMLKMVKRKYKKCFPELLVRASFNIEVVFGMELKEVDCTKHCYSLVSKMNLPYNGMLKGGRGFPKTGLLMNLLGVIFMKGNSITEEEIWKFLNKMRIYAGKKHFLFGEPKKLITKELVKLKYLEYRRVPDSDPPQYEFLWGPRAYAETSKMKVLEFWAKINDTIPSAFQSRYEEALRDEEEGADIIISLSDSTSTTDSENSTPLTMTSPVVIEDDDEEDSSL